MSERRGMLRGQPDNQRELLARYRGMRPMKVHGPLDTPAIEHNKSAELQAVRVLQDRAAWPTLRHDAEAILVGLGWPELAIKLAKGQKPGVRIMKRAAVMAVAAGMLSLVAASSMPARAAVSSPADAARMTAGLGSVFTADTGASVKLPDGKVLYIGGDATRYRGQSYGTPQRWWFPHQVGALETAPGSGIFTAVRGQRDATGCDCQLVPDFAGGGYFWPGGLLVTSTAVLLYGQEIRGLGLAAHPVASYVAKFSAFTLAYEGIIQLRLRIPLLGLADAVAVRGGHWLIASQAVPCSYAQDCFDGRPVWIPAGDEARPSAWDIYPAVIPASINAGSVIDMFTHAGHFYAVSKKGDVYGGYSVLELLTAACMTCQWHVARLWPAMGGQDSYSARAHTADSAAGQIMLSNSTGRPYGTAFEAFTLP